MYVHNIPHLLWFWWIKLYCVVKMPATLIQIIIDFFLLIRLILRHNSAIFFLYLFQTSHSGLYKHRHWLHGIDLQFEDLISYKIYLTKGTGKGVVCFGFNTSEKRTGVNINHSINMSLVKFICIL